MNKLTMKMRLFAAFLLLGLWGATAQTAREQIAAMPERAGGIYHSYEYLPGPAVPPRRAMFPSTSATMAATAAVGILRKRSMLSRWVSCAKPTRPGC